MSKNKTFDPFSGRFMRVRVYLNSEKHIIRHLLTSLDIPGPLNIEKEYKIEKNGDTIDIILEAKE